MQLTWKSMVTAASATSRQLKGVAGRRLRRRSVVTAPMPLIESKP